MTLLFVLALFSTSLVYSQDFAGLVSDSPFDTALEVETVESSQIKQNLAFASHNFKRVNNSKFGVSTRYLELNNSKVAIPNYYSAQFGLNYRHYLENERFWGISGTYGSSSNDLFKDHRDSTIMLNATYKMNPKWLLLVNYSNNRSFFNNIPLPGFVYVHEQTKDNVMLFGFPFVFILKPFYQNKFSVRYLGLFPYNHKLRILYNDFSWFKPYVTVEQGPHPFFDTGRRDAAVRIFWFERRAGIGGEKSFGPFLKIDLQLGNSFDREYFDARSFGDKHDDVKQISDSTYIALNLKSNF